MSTIFSRPFSDIQAMQQGVFKAPKLLPISRDVHKAQIENDIARFGVPVSAEIVTAYAITLPAHYTLTGDTWTPAIQE